MVMTKYVSFQMFLFFFPKRLLTNERCIFINIFWIITFSLKQDNNKSIIIYIAILYCYGEKHASLSFNVYQSLKGIVYREALSFLSP